MIVIALAITLITAPMFMYKVPLTGFEKRTLERMTTTKNKIDVFLRKHRLFELIFSIALLSIFFSESFVKSAVNNHILAPTFLLLLGSTSYFFIREETIKKGVSLKDKIGAYSGIFIITFILFNLIF